MSLRDFEQIVQHALDAGLIGPDMRRQLLAGLPMSFVYSLPTVSRPIDQLRFDLMELSRTPRLIGLSRPPMALWLENAMVLAQTRRNPEAARYFARQADQHYGGGPHTERLEDRLPSAEPDEPEDRRRSNRSHGISAPEPRPAQSWSTRAPAASASHERPAARHGPTATDARAHARQPTHPTDRRVTVLTVNPDAEFAWREVEPRIEPHLRFPVKTLEGDWARRHGPQTPAWDRVVASLDQVLGDIRPTIRSGECLAVFARLPLALACLLGARLNDRLGLVDALAIFDFDKWSRPRWRPWGPAWSAPVRAEPEARLVSHGQPESAATAVALIIDLQDPIDDEDLDPPLAGTGAPGMPRFRVELDGRASEAADDPVAIETSMRDLVRHVRDIARRHRRLRDVHLFLSVPLAMAIRVGALLHDQRFSTTVYHFQARDGFVPALRLGGAEQAALVSMDDLKARAPVGARPVSEFDGLIISLSDADTKFAKDLHEELEAKAFDIFSATRSLELGDDWTRVLPDALERARVVVVVASPGQKAWYRLEDLFTALDLRLAGVTRRVIPVLRGAEEISAHQLPYGIRRLVPLRLHRDAEAHEAVDRLAELLERERERARAESARREGEPSPE